jgi:hypothetical protein
VNLARSVPLIVSCLVVGACGGLAGGASSEEDSIRPWSVSAGSDSAGVAILAEVDFETPPDVREVTVSVEAELSFATSGGDFGRVRASIYSEQTSPEGAREPIRMLPREGHDLGSAGPPAEDSTLSVSWRLEGVAAEGRSYSLELWGVALDGDGEPQASISGEGESVRVQVKPDSA